MKKFLIKISIFSLFAILLFLPLDLVISEKLSINTWHAFGETAAWNNVIEGEIDADLYIYGSSRAWHHVDPAIIEEELGLTAYNFGVDGHNFDIQNLRHQLLMRYNRKPEYIIYSLDCFTLRKRPNLYLRDQFLPFMLKYRELMPVMLTFNGFHWTDFYVPLLRYHERRQALSVIAKHWNSKEFPKRRTKGFKYNPEKELEIKEDDKRTPYGIPQIDEVVDMFEAFLTECEEEGIQVIMIYSPEFHLHQKQVWNRKEIMANFRRISEAYNIPFIDYSDNPICQDTKYFFDNLHLNKRGAETFSRQLAADLEPYLK